MPYLEFVGGAHVKFVTSDGLVLWDSLLSEGGVLDAGYMDFPAPLLLRRGMMRFSLSLVASMGEGETRLPLPKGTKVYGRGVRFDHNDDMLIKFAHEGLQEIQEGATLPVYAVSWGTENDGRMHFTGWHSRG